MCTYSHNLDCNSHILRWKQNGYPRNIPPMTVIRTSLIPGYAALSTNQMVRIWREGYETFIEHRRENIGFFGVKVISLETPPAALPTRPSITHSGHVIQSATCMYTQVYLTTTILQRHWDIFRLRWLANLTNVFVSQRFCEYSLINGDLDGDQFPILISYNFFYSSI